jgi:hypothetical protein
MESTATDDGLEEFWGIVGAKKSNADHSSTSIFRTTPAVSGRGERMRASGPLERVVRSTVIVLVAIRTERRGTSPRCRTRR